MLIDTKGRVVNPDKLPKGKANREAVLAGLKEVPDRWRGHGKSFNLGERARLVEKRK
jgi:hypothetical protein